MKIITMERKTLDGKSVEYGIEESREDYRDWWCVIETEEEELVYDNFLQFLHGDDVGDRYSKAYTALWNDMIKHAGIPLGLKWGDDDLYGYILPNEVEPEVGGKYKDTDGDIWERVE